MDQKEAREWVDTLPADLRLLVLRALVLLAESERRQALPEFAPVLRALLEHVAERRS